VKPHYERIRRVKTHSGATAIQVGSYRGKLFQLTKHIGSSKDTKKITELVSMAEEYICTHSPQLALNFNTASEEILFKKGIHVEKSCLEEAYTYLSSVYTKLGLSTLESDILKHFSMIRVLEPASKAKSIILLQKYFDITYRKTTVFRELAKLSSLKEDIIRIVIQYAKDNLSFDFSLVFYDVTTLYFETHTQDEFRRNGFSKDNKINQPQVLIGLVVNALGFPIYYDIFKGNTFEGKTIIPVITKLKKQYSIQKFTVVADAGMLSEENLTELEKQSINYVVGARVGNLKLEEAQTIANGLGKVDKKILRKDSIIYEYSLVRAKKDKADNDKQVSKAEYYLQNPAKVMKRSMFLANDGKKKFILNETLIERHRLLEGIKGYRTNITDVANKLLIARYKDLWRVEKSFRIAKSDLEARPIYHRRENSIQYHILIVFIALCMAKVIEMEKQESIQKVMESLKDKWTLTLVDEISRNSLNLPLIKNHTNWETQDIYQ
jgi:transposase